MPVIKAISLHRLLPIRASLQNECRVGTLSCRSAPWNRPQRSPDRRPADYPYRPRDLSSSLSAICAS